MPNWNRVETYGIKTMRMIRKAYPWYRPSPAIHRLCLHPKQLMGNRELPPGFYSESSQECYNKRDRNTRQFHVRKTNRKDNTTDIFQNHLAYGDPLFSSTMSPVPEEKFPVLPELQKLFQQEENNDLDNTLEYEEDEGRE